MVSCNSCKSYLPDNYFGFYATNKMRKTCKKCQNEKNQMYRKLNPDKLKVWIKNAKDKKSLEFPVRKIEEGLIL